jgi:hypothetical protein
LLKQKNSFTIKTLEELLSVLDLKGEIEFIQQIFFIFGENISSNIKHITNNYIKEISKKKINFREVFNILAFFRMENIKAKISRKNIEI